MNILLILQLLDCEVQAREQVPLLMEMKKADLALDKAIESGDPQLGMFLSGKVTHVEHRKCTILCFLVVLLLCCQA